jgi:hypothetical protein
MISGQRPQLGFERGQRKHEVYDSCVCTLTYNGLLLDMYNFEKVLTTQICRILIFLELSLVHCVLATRLLTRMDVK